MTAWRTSAVMAALFVALTATAYAKPIKKNHHRQNVHRNYHDADPRPGRWCMWWLRRHLGIPKSAFPAYAYNLAISGKYIGTPAVGPAIGVIVVWRNHVGIISGQSAAGWIVTSGNDGGAVRTRERSLRGVIAYRWPSTQWAMR